MRDWAADAPPLVSISCITYNHESYIRDAIEGFLIQETDFPFEILIHDDASTDRTADIIREYEEQYPKLIKPIYQTENQYSQGRKPGLNNINRAQGKYIALCEGDDYWTDRRKLQKQVFFLGNHPDYSLVHSDVDTYNVVTKEWNRCINRNSPRINNQWEGDVFLRIIECSYMIRTCTVVYRRSLRETITAQNPQIYSCRRFAMGDTPCWLDFSKLSKLKYFDETTAVYRILPDSASRSTNPEKDLNFQESALQMRLFYLKKYGYSQEVHRKIALKRARSLFKCAILSGHKPMADHALSIILEWNGKIPRRMLYLYLLGCSFIYKLIWNIKWLTGKCALFKRSA